MKDATSNWYFFDISGENQGKGVKKGWRNINNEWYYFNSDCVMLYNTITPDGYFVNNDGAWVR